MVFSPSAASRWLRAWKSSWRMKISPRTSTTSGTPLGSWFGHVRHHADIGGDVLALVAVAAGGGGDEPALLVADRARQAVDLRLGGDRQRLVRRQAQEAADAGDELGDILLAEGVVERQHRHRVHDLAEAADRCRTDPLARAVLALEAGEARLDRKVAPAERVVVRIRDAGVVLLVVAAVVLGDRGREARKFARGLGGGEVFDGLGTGVGHGRIRLPFGVVDILAALADAGGASE